MQTVFLLYLSLVRTLDHFHFQNNIMCVPTIRTKSGKWRQPRNGKNDRHFTTLCNPLAYRKKYFFDLPVQVFFCYLMEHISWAQLFEGRLVLNPRFPFLVFKSIFSDNFLSYFQSFQSSTCGQKELKLNCFLSFQILIQISH